MNEIEKFIDQFYPEDLHASILIGLNEEELDNIMQFYNVMVSYVANNGITVTTIYNEIHDYSLKELLEYKPIKHFKLIKKNMANNLESS